MRAGVLTRATLLVMVLAALVLRWSWTGPDFVVSRDSVEYLRAAIAIEKEGVGAVRGSLRQPLFPAAIWTACKFADIVDADFAFSGEEVAQAGRWLNVALYVPFLLVAWVFFREVGGARCALPCTVVLAVHPLFSRYFANVLSETLYLTFLLAALYLMVKAFSQGVTSASSPWLWGLAAGMVTALAWLTRVEGQMLIGAGLASAALNYARGRKAGHKLVRSLLPGLAVAGGFILVAVPVMLYLGASAQRYSWEWVFERLTARGAPAADGVAAQLAGFPLASGPVMSAWMLVREFMSRAPLVAGAFVAALAQSSRFAFPRIEGFRLPDQYRPVLVTLALYAALIVVGVSIQNGVVSQRYIQPLVLMMLPGAMLFFLAVSSALSERLKRRPSHSAGAIVVVILFVVSFVSAARRWDDNKTGLKKAGAEIARAAPDGAMLLTSSPRLSFYAGAIPGIQAPDALEQSILAGDGVLYAFVALETHDFDKMRVENMTEALETQGFSKRPWLDIAEERSGEPPGRRIMLFRRKTQQ